VEAPAVSARAWITACRPATLTVGVAPVLVGTACAAALGGFRAGPALAALVGALLLQIGSNLANDVFDHEKGADGADRLGPPRAVASGLLTARQVKAGMVLALGLAFCVGVYLAAVAGPAIIVIGLAAIASAVLYTGGPWPLGYHGLGDLFVMIFFGFVAVCGTAFVQVGGVPALAVWASVPVGALATAVLVINNLRDREQDARSGKRTLAVRLGREGALGELVLLLVSAYAVPVGLALGGRPLVLFSLLTAPLAWRLGVQIFRTSGRALNPLLGQAARLTVVHSAALALTLWPW
jgi:1,4-dihydroxy-2-naphthoate octaprenyltransferase